MGHFNLEIKSSWKMSVKPLKPKLTLFWRNSKNTNIANNPREFRTCQYPTYLQWTVELYHFQQRIWIYYYFKEKQTNKSHWSKFLPCCNTREMETSKTCRSWHDCKAFNLNKEFMTALHRFRHSKDKVLMSNWKQEQLNRSNISITL